MSNAFWDKLIPGRKPKPPKPPAPIDPAPIEPPPAPAGPLARGELVQIPGPFHPRLYSYWANAFVGRDNVIYVFGGHQQAGPYLYEIRDGRLAVHSALPGSGTTEGWYWDARLARIYQPEGPRLMLLDPFSGARETVMDISALYPGCRVFQTHSSDDGRVHSATAQSLVDWKFIATVVFINDAPAHWKAEGVIDESQITPDGKYIIIKETNADFQLYNRIIKLPYEFEFQLGPQERLGHSDCGNGFIIGEDSHLGAAVRYDLETRKRKEIFGTWNMGHVSVRGNCALFSRHEEGKLELFEFFPEGGGSSTYIFNHGIKSNDYDLQVRANLSPCGRVAAFTMNGDLWVLGL